MNGKIQLIQMIMNVEVRKEDIENIGHTVFKGDDGNLIIICSVNSANIEQILLRTILKCFGDEYMVVSEYDVDEDIAFITNLPYSVYEEIEIV